MKHSTPKPGHPIFSHRALLILIALAVGAAAPFALVYVALIIAQGAR